MDLNEIKDTLATETFGMSRTDALKQGVCLECKQPAEPKCHSAAGKREYELSALCEECFDTMFADMEDAMDDGDDEEAF